MEYFSKLKRGGGGKDWIDKKKEIQAEGDQ